MESKIVVAVICGTARKGSESMKVAKWVAEQGRQRDDIEIIFVDPVTFTLPPDGAPEDGEDPKYAEITIKADAFFVVTPEYNHSYPGSLKRLIDSEYGNYLRKPVATAGVSNGSWGGVRACEALLPVYHRVGLVSIVSELYFPRVQDLFDERGVLKAEVTDMYVKNVTKTYDELVWFAKALKAAKA